MLTRGAVNSLHLPYVHIYDLHIIAALYALWARDSIINLLRCPDCESKTPMRGGLPGLGERRCVFWSSDESIALKAEILLPTIRRQYGEIAKAWFSTEKRGDGVLWDTLQVPFLRRIIISRLFYIQAPLMFNFHCIATIMNQIAHQLADAAKKFTL